MPKGNSKGRKTSKRKDESSSNGNRSDKRSRRSRSGTRETVTRDINSPEQQTSTDQNGQVIEGQRGPRRILFRAALNSVDETVPEQINKNVNAQPLQRVSDGNGTIQNKVKNWSG